MAVARQTLTMQMENMEKHQCARIVMKTIKTSEKRRHKNEIIMIKNSPNYNYISEVS